MLCKREAGSASDMINSADDNMPDEEDYPDDNYR